MTSVSWTAGQKITAANLNAMETGQLMTPSVSTTVANTTTETVLAAATIAANTAAVGQVYRMKAWGNFGVTGTPTLTLRARIGGTGGTSIGQSGAMSIASGVTGRIWMVEFDVSVLSIGTSATWFTHFHSKASTAAGSAPFVNDGTSITTAIDGTNIDTKNSTVSNDLVVTATWSAASASNTITCYGFTSELLQ